MSHEENKNLDKFIVDPGADALNYADPDDDSLADWLTEPVDPAEEAHMHMADAYVMGDVTDPETGRGFYYGYRPEELDTWFGSLDDAQKAQYAEQRALRELQSSGHHRYIVGLERGLSETAPSLLEGRLPPEQEALLPTPNYVIGTNQSGVITFEEVDQYIKDNEGIDFTSYNLNHRFQFFDADVPAHTILNMLGGYYNEAGGGRFVVAVPDNGALPGEAVTSRPDRLWLFGHLPADFVIEQGAGDDVWTSVNPKYLAGYIHMDGRYYPNRSFMQDPSGGPRFDVRPPDDDDWL